MRISDWSSDVCSSDLKEKIDSASLRDTGYESLWSFVTFDTFWLWPKNSASLAQRRSCILNNRRCRGPSRNWKKNSAWRCLPVPRARSEEHTSELQSLMRISYAVFCLKKKIKSQKSSTKYNINKLRQKDKN